MYISDSATNFIDFLDKLKSNLISEDWNILEDTTISSSRQMYFKNNISNTIVGFKESSSSHDYFNLYLNSPTSYSSSFDFFNQIGSIENYPQNTVTTGNQMPVLSLINTPFNFWLFIDNDRVIIVVKCNTSYNSAYLGRFEQYGSPLQYPKPLFVGGNASSATMLNSSTASTNECFIFENSEKEKLSGARFKNYNNEWIVIDNGSYALKDNFGAIYPTYSLGILNSYTTDNDYLIEPLVLISDVSACGELKNIFWVTGRGLSAEATITIDTEEYIVFPNIFRTTDKDYYCIKKI